MHVKSHQIVWENPIFYQFRTTFHSTLPNHLADATIQAQAFWLIKFRETINNKVVRKICKEMEDIVNHFLLPRNFSRSDHKSMTSIILHDSIDRKDKLIISLPHS